VLEKLRRFGKEFYATDLQPFTQKWKNCVDIEEEYFVGK
jgi:hypothetical protein